MMAGSRPLGCAWGSARAMPAPFSGASAPLPSDTFDNVPQSLSEGDRKPRRIQKPKTPAAEKCLRKCVGTCIRGGAGAPGEGPINVERPIVVFKSEFRSRQYCLVECSEICNLLWSLNQAAAAAIPNANTETKLRRIQFSQAELNAATTLRAAQRPQAPRRGGGTAQLAQRERTEAPTELRVPLNGAAMSVASLSEMLLVRPRGAAAGAKQSSAEADGYASCPQFQPWKGALARISACKWRRPGSATPAGPSSPSTALRLFMIDFLEDKRGRAVENECRDRRWIWPRPLVTGGEVCVDEADELRVDGDDLNDDDNNEEELPELVGAAELMERVRAALGQRRGEQRSRLEANEADEVVEVGALGGGGVLRFNDVFVNSKGTVFNESHVFAVDACGRGQWSRQGGAVKALKDSISFAPGTHVSVHEHLVNLLPYEQEDAEQQAEDAEEAEMAERGLRGTDWVAQARLHNSKERLLARLLPALYLVATALMPDARQYPLLLRSEHLLEHLGRSMFGVDLASLSVHHLPASRQHREGHRHLFYAKTLFMPVHASSVCGLSSSGRPRAPDVLWLALRGHHLLPPDGLPILSPDWTPRLPASAQPASSPQSAPPAAHPLHHLAVGRTLPEDWVVVVSLVWSAHVIARGGGGVGDGNARTAETRHTEEAMEAIVGMLRELYSEERVVVYEEHLPLRKAKALFSRTILLVGPTSPALSNIIFMPFNSTVIEILPYVVNGTLESSKSKVEDLQRDGKTGGKLANQQSTATWHYRLSERVGVHHLLSVCDPERNHMDESEMCHVDEVYATVTASLRKNPVLREATGLPPVTFPPDDVSRLGDFSDFIPGSRLRKGTGQVAGFRQWAECVAERGEWRFNATPRVLAWPDHGVEKCDAEWEAAGGIASTKADKVAARGPAAAADWKVRDTLKYEWVVPTNKCPKATGFGAAQLAVPSSEVLNPQELFSRFDGRGLCELAWRRKGGLRVAFLGDSLSRESHVNFVNNIPWGFFSPDPPSPHIHACAWRPMAADDALSGTLPVSQSSKSSASSSAVLARLSGFMQQFLADRASGAGGGGGGAVGGGSGRAGGVGGAAVGGRSVAVQQDCAHWKWLWPRPLVTRGEMCLDEDEVWEFVEEWVRAEQETQQKLMASERKKERQKERQKQGLVKEEIAGEESPLEGLEVDPKEARVHSGGTRGLVRLLPALFLLASSLMPTARRFPILLNHDHLLSHLGPDVFGVDLAPLAIRHPSLLFHNTYSSSSDASYNDPGSGPDLTTNPITTTGMPPHLFFARTLLLPIHTPSLCGLSAPPLTALHSSPPRTPDALWLALRGLHLLPPHGLPILSPDWTPRLPSPLQMPAPENSPEDSPEVSPEDFPDGLVVGQLLPEDWVVVVSVVWSTHVMEGGGGGEGVRETEAAIHVIIAMLKELFSDGRVIVYDENMPLLQAKALFSRTILLVGPTSPALTNLLFMPFNSTVVEILPYPVTRPRSSLPLSLLLRSPYHKKAAAEAALIGQPSAATWHFQLAERLGIRHYLSVCDPTWLDKGTGEKCHVDEVYATVLATVRRNPPLLALTGIPVISFPPDAVQLSPEPPTDSSTGIRAKPSDLAEAASRFGDLGDSIPAELGLENGFSDLGDFSDAIPGSRLHKGTGQVADFRRWAACVAERGEWRFNATPRVLPWSQRGYDVCDLALVRENRGLGGADADAVALVREMGREERERAWKVRDAVKYQWGVAKERCPRVVRAKLGAQAQAVPGSEVSEPDELFSRFDGPALCELARRRVGGLRIAFVGDSLTRESHFSFVNSVVTHVRKPASVVTRKDGAMWVGQMSRTRGDTYTRVTYRFDDAGCGELVVHYIANRRLVPVGEEMWERVRWISTPWMESEEIKGAHVVVINRGAHFKPTGNVVLSVSRTLQFLRYNYPEKLIVYRATAPGHLNCKDYSKPLLKRQNGSDLPFHWGEFKVQNEAVRPLVEAMGGVFMDIDPLSALRPDGHRVFDGKVDCLHYCLPGPEDTWSEFLYNIIQRLVPVK
ncbi:unnamed protein product [Closterium sp. Yama58-4]|nr:unnamed protein product [Closterium sp. Yama58-4]